MSSRSFIGSRVRDNDAPSGGRIGRGSSFRAREGVGLTDALALDACVISGDVAMELEIVEDVWVVLSLVRAS